MTQLGNRLVCLITRCTKLWPFWHHCNKGFNKRCSFCLQ